MTLLRTRKDSATAGQMAEPVNAVSPVTPFQLLRPWAALASVTLLLLAMGFLAWTLMNRPTPSPAPRSPAVGGMLVDPAAFPAPPFALRDQNGALVTPETLRGHVTLIAFLDPVCTSLCPLLGRQLGQIDASMPAGQRPQLVLISVAPHRSAAQASKFARSAGLAPGWRFLLGPAAALPPTWKAFHVTVIPRTKDVLHDGAVVLLDRRGMVRDEFYAPLPTALLTTEVKALTGT